MLIIETLVFTAIVGKVVYEIASERKSKEGDAAESGR